MQNAIFLFVFLISSVYTFSYAEKVSIFGKLKNGTNQSVGRADSIKMIALQGGMVPIAELGPSSANFRFPPLDLPEGAPILLQVTYKGVNYNKMIPPAPQFQLSEQEVIVYETTLNSSFIETKSLMQVIREKSGLRVFKLFLLENKSNPPQSFSKVDSTFAFAVPKEATEVFLQIQQPGSKMAIPLQVKESPLGGKTWDRALLPGLSELQLSYLIPPPLEEWEETFYLEGPQLPIFLKPTDMKLELTSGGSLTKLEKDIPEGLVAYSLASNERGTVRLRFSGGTPVPTPRGNQPPDISNGKFLTDTERSLLAVSGFVALFFSLSFLFLYLKEKA